MNTALKNQGNSLRITALHNGKDCGFVKQIDYNNGEVHLTNDKDFALVYDNEDKVHSDIDFLTKYYFESGYVFTY